jgi:hypothetical protein
MSSFIVGYIMFRIIEMFIVKIYYFFANGK